MAGTEPQAAWVHRVLGVNTSAGVQDGDASSPMLPIWLDAKDEADKQIGALQQALRGFDDPDLQRIAEFGLNGVTGKSSVGLMVALREADQPGGGGEARVKLGEAIEGYRRFLSDDKIVDMLEENPFGVTVTLRKTLGGALDTLVNRIAA